MLPFSHKTIKRSNSDGGDEAWLTVRIALPKVADGVEGRPLCRPANFFNIKRGEPFLYGLDFVQGGTVMLTGTEVHTVTGKGHAQTSAMKFKAHYFDQIPSHATALRFPLTMISRPKVQTLSG